MRLLTIHFVVRADKDQANAHLEEDHCLVLWAGAGDAGRAES